MATRLPVIEILTFAFALWLGLYLVARDPRNPRLRFTGLGLVAYGLGLAGHILASLDPAVARWSWPLLFLPALFWSGATFWFVPQRQPTTTRLAASPLTHLPLVEARLAARGANGNTLDRASELKAVLAESIARLKPPGEDEFGTSDEWRYYNALYFPYVAGLKVHSRRAARDHLDAPAQAATAWFRTYVPERTLFNWQNAAARLVAQDLLERSSEIA